MLLHYSAMWAIQVTDDVLLLDYQHLMKNQEHVELSIFPLVCTFPHMNPDSFRNLPPETCSHLRVLLSMIIIPYTGIMIVILSLINLKTGGK